MNRTCCLLAVAAAATLTLSALPAQAGGRHGGHVVIGPVFHGHFGHGHGHWRGGRHWGGVGLGIGIGLAAPLYYERAYAQPYYYPGPVYAAPPLAYSEPVPMAAPEPVIYPRNNQSPAQTESDRRACDRWAISQPSAMADARVFHRATLACMEGRGYTVR
jgi:hypothetical protein